MGTRIRTTKQESSFWTALGVSFACMLICFGSANIILFAMLQSMGLPALAERALIGFPLGSDQFIELLSVVYFGATALRFNAWLASPFCVLATLIVFPVYGYSGLGNNWELWIKISSLRFSLFLCALILDWTLLIFYAIRKRRVRKRSYMQTVAQ